MIVEIDGFNSELRKLNIELPSGRFFIDPTAHITPPICVRGYVQFLRGLHIDAFSYSFSGISNYIGSMGRYCSIAGESTFGDAEHPVHWLSTSSFAYDSQFPMWKEFTPSRLRNFVPLQLDSQPRRGPLSIGNDVWVGKRAFIRGGVTIGDGAIIGTGAVVTKDVPPYAVVVGNPGRVVRYRFSDAIIESLLKLRWWRFCYTQFNGVDFSHVEKAIDQIYGLEATGGLQEYIAEPLVVVSLPGVRSVVEGA